MASGLTPILIATTVIVLASAAAVLGLSRAILGGEQMNERLQKYAALPMDAPQRSNLRRPSRLARLRLRLNSLLASLSSEQINMDLMRANWDITVAEYLLLRIGGTLVAFVLSWLLLGSPVPGIGLAIIVYLTPGVILRWRVSRRQIEFEKQLVDVLVLLNGAVRAGFSLLQATEIVIEEMKPPASEEFSRVRREVQLGLSFPNALRNMTARVDNDDLQLLVTAIEIQHQVGGNLATMLSAVTETIRERMRLFGEVRVLTTQQRYTSYLLSVLPFFVGGMLFLMNPAYMLRLFEPRMVCIPIGSLAGIILGHVIIQRIAKIDV